MKECHGNLADIGLPKLLHLIYKRNDDFGVLNISREPIKKRFFFSGGIPVFATSNILGEVLGRLLMLEGIITQSDYEKSLEIVLKENRLHGEVLTSMGLITDAELDNFLYLQLKRRAWKVFGWNEGTYRYESIKSLPAGATPMPLHPAKMILDGISLGFYPLEKIRDELSTCLDTVMVPAFESTRYRVEDFGLNIQETRFFEMFDGDAAVKEVLDSSFLLKQRALSLTLSLILTGALAAKGKEPAQEELELVEEPEHAKGISTAPGSRLSAELLFMRAKSDFSESNFKSAVDTLKQIVEINPMEGEYWAWLGWALYNREPSRIKEAEKIVKDAIDLNNELDGAWYFLARIFFHEGRHKAAEEAYKTACDKNPWMLEAVAELKRIEIRRSLGIGTDAVVRPGYMDHFGFTLDPFSAEPHDRFKITTTGQTETLETTLSAIQKKEGPILIEAAEGAGKTTLLIELLRSLSNKKTLVALILSPAKKELQLIKTINAELHAVTESNSIKEQLLSLGMRVSQNNSQGGSTIIVLDRAEELTTGCLKLVQYLARLKSLQIILIGAPGISDRLDEPGFVELSRKTLVRLDIPPLTLAETGEFFRKRVAAAPTNPPTATRPAIDRRALELLFKKSEGNPGKVVRNCMLLLAGAAAQQKSAIGSALAANALGLEPPSDTATGEEPKNTNRPTEAETAETEKPRLAEPAPVSAEEEPELIKEVVPASAETSGAAEDATSKRAENFILEPVTEEEPGADGAEENISELNNEPVAAEELIIEVDRNNDEKEGTDLDLLEDVIKTTGKKSATGTVNDKTTATEVPQVKEATQVLPESPETIKVEEKRAGAEERDKEAAEDVEVEAAQKKPKRKGGLTRIILIIILMVVLGLAAGSLVNEYLLGP